MKKADDWLKSKGIDPSEIGAVTELFLADVECDNGDLAIIKSLQKMETLSIGGSSISIEGSRHIASLSNLFFLVLSRTAISDEGLDILTSLSDLQSLGLHDDSITQKGFSVISKFSNLVSLGLSGKNLTDQSLESIAIDSLRELSLSKSEISNKVFEIIKNNFPCLASLIIDSDKIDSVSLDTLKEMPLLNYLSIENTKINNNMLLEVKNALPGCNVITR